MKRSQRRRASLKGSLGSRVAKRAPRSPRHPARGQGEEEAWGHLAEGEVDPAPQEGEDEAEEEVGAHHLLGGKPGGVEEEEGPQGPGPGGGEAHLEADAEGRRGRSQGLSSLVRPPSGPAKAQAPPRGPR